MKEENSSRLNQCLLGAFRSMRKAMYYALTPLDSFFCRINRLSNYPPIHLRRHVGHLGAGFNGSGYEFAVYLKLLAGLRKDDFVWDLGCGCGLLELALEDLGWRGRLTGTDIHGPCIEWAQKNITCRIPSFSFIHSDMYSSDYWPKGKMNTREWLTVFDQKDFDIIVAKSVFTHLLPGDFDLYLQTVSNRLKPGGKALLTFFLLNEEQKKMAEAGLNQFTFHALDGITPCSVRRPMAPTAAVAYEEKYVVSRMKDYGLSVDARSIYHGIWSGIQGGLSFQDIIVATR